MESDSLWTHGLQHARLSHHLPSPEVKSLSHVRLFATPWTVAYQAPPSMGFSRQEYCSGLPFPSPGDLPDQGIKPGSPSLQADALTSEPPGKPLLQKFAQIHVHRFSDAILPSLLLCPLLLLPSIFPNIRVFSSESAFCIRWPKNWSVSFNISPSSEYSELNSFRIDWFDLLTIQVTLKNLL